MTGCNTQTVSDQLEPPETGDEIVVFETTMGVIKVKLSDEELVPETYKNFVTLVNEGQYDGTIFHRVMDGFMVQGGDIEHLDGYGGHSYQGEGTTIAEEFDPSLRHHRGALSMAKTQAPHSTGSQFFIVHAMAGTPSLDDVHSVFGQTFEGMDIVDAIAGVEVDPNAKPFENIVLKSVKIETY